MSGGYFDYKQSFINYINDDIDHLIEKLKDNTLDVENKEQFLETLTAASKALNAAYVYTQRLDWYLSGDDSEETMYLRLKDDLTRIGMSNE